MEETWPQTSLGDGGGEAARKGPGRRLKVAGPLPGLRQPGLGPAGRPKLTRSEVAKWPGPQSGPAGPWPRNEALGLRPKRTHLQGGGCFRPQRAPLDGATTAWTGKPGSRMRRVQSAPTRGPVGDRAATCVVTASKTRLRCRLRPTWTLRSTW